LNLLINKVKIQTIYSRTVKMDQFNCGMHSYAKAVCLALYHKIINPRIL